MEEPSDLIRKRISSLMRINNKGQKQVAMDANIAQSTISQILSGGRGSSVNVLSKIATALGTDMNYLCGFNTENFQAAKDRIIIEKIAELVGEL